ncbi:(2Fe-2S)-binding protein [Luteimonas sp. A478]
MTIILDCGEMEAVSQTGLCTVYVCLCHGVTDSEIRDAATAGCGEMSELMMRTGCGSSCGSCIETASGLLDEVHGRDAEDAPEAAPLALPVIAEAA